MILPTLLKGVSKYARGNRKAAEAQVRNTTPDPVSTVSKMEVAAAAGAAGAAVGTIAERENQKKKNQKKPKGVGKAEKGFGRAMNNGN